VPTHGFTRNALSLSVLSLPQRHEAPLSETAVSALFGDGDDARRTLVRFWLDDAVRRMKEGTEGKRVTISEVLKARLKANEDVLAHLPEVCLGSPCYLVKMFYG
jgi:ubiquinone biosynthesis protein COQ9